MGANWGFRKMVKSLDDSAKSSTSRDSEQSAFHMFRNMDRKGSSKAGAEDTTLPTVHQNTITYTPTRPQRLPAMRLGFADCGRMLRAFEEGASGVSKIASSGLDGKIVIWDVGLEGKVGGMRIRH
jgi:actin related protein 2/3 complex, subunit 1A/1B